MFPKNCSTFITSVLYKRFINLDLVMIVLEMSLFMKGLWLDRMYSFFRSIFIKNSVQVVENASNPFSFRDLPYILN